MPLTPLFGFLTERAARTLNFPQHTLGGVYHAEEQTYFDGAEGLDDGVEKGHPDCCLSLTSVSQQVWDDGLVVGQALTHRDSDRLTDATTAAYSILRHSRI